MAQAERHQSQPDSPQTDDQTNQGDANEVLVSREDVLPGFTTEERDPRYVQQLRDRVEAAFDEQTVASHEPEIELWPLRTRMLCLFGGSALCWAVILAPFLL